MADLKGKVGIVTGGGTGIGRATALAMAKSAILSVVASRDAERRQSRWAEFVAKVDHRRGVGSLPAGQEAFST